MFLALEDKGVIKEASLSILLMSGKDLFKEGKKEHEIYFVVIGKLRVILSNNSKNAFSVEIRESLHELFTLWWMNCLRIYLPSEVLVIILTLFQV
jgi:hypothetical protein